MRGFVCLGLLTICGFTASLGQAAENCTRLEYSLEEIGQLRLNKLPVDVFAPWAGKTLRQITVEPGDVFDPANPDENNLLYRNLDKFHINTRPSVIRAQLLFKPGEPLDVSKMAESGRILRSRSYLASAYLVPVQVCGEFIDVRVVTRDSWSTEPDTSLSHNGGETKSGIGLSENNLFGTGNRVAISYDQLPQRTSVSYEISSPHLFNSDYAAALVYVDKSDGVDKTGSLQKPFTSLTSRWAYGVLSKDLTQTEYLNAHQQTLSSFGHKTLRNEVFVGRALDADEKHTERLLAGFTQAEDTFTANALTRLPVPEWRRNAYPWLGYRHIENEFGVFKNVRQIQSLEDVALGRDFFIRLGYSGNDFDNPRDTILMRSQLTDSIGVSTNHLFEFAGGLDARWQTETGGQHTSLGYAALAYNYFISDRQRWFLSARYDLGQALDSYEELRLGGSDGLRGYPVDFQRGDHRMLFKLERRYFSDWHVFNLVRLGAVAYAESGKAWGSAYDQNQKLLTDVGIGLRFSSSKAHIGTVVHLDLAMPLTERDQISEVQWIVSTRQQF